MYKLNQKVICIGSTGKDIFFPVSSGTVLETKDKPNNKQFCFGYGGKVHVEDRFSELGGCACNVSVGLARLGVDVAALGNVGNDSDGRWIIRKLKKENVNTEAIVTVDNLNTDLSIIIVDANSGERTIFVNRDVGEQLEIDEKYIKGFDWCFIGSLYGENIENNMQIIHDMLLNKEMKLAYNPGGKNIKQDENIVLDLIHHAKLVFVNKLEAREIVSKFNLSYNKDVPEEEFLMSMIKKHMNDEDGIVVLTDGLRGAWSLDAQKIYHTNVINKKVKDSTGAGDAFASGFFAGILCDLTLEKSMQFGSINGDSVVDYYGAQKGLKKVQTIEENVDLFIVESKKIHNGII